MSPRAWMLFAAVSVLWGIPYLFIKIAVEELSPVAVAFGRVALGFAVLLPYAWHRGALRGLPARWKAMLAYTVVEIVLPWPLIGFGEQRVTSSLAAILIASVPLVIAIMALRFDPDERAEGSRLAGLFVGFAGVVALLGLDVAGRPGELLGAVAILAAAVGYACGPMIIKHRLADLDPLGPVTASLGLATVLLAPAALTTAPSSAPSADAIVAVVVLGLVCSALAFLCFFALIADVGPGRASIITYVNPAVAVALGVTLLGERVGPTAVAGLLLILAGSWLSTGGRMPPGIPVRWRRRAAGVARSESGASTAGADQAARSSSPSLIAVTRSRLQ
ncbi:MAG TPA: EamA family transporter [Solirubrobacteraceae bacterium]|nr:EamA family transporter [Solirubrobacteraceae bacterium]